MAENARAYLQVTHDTHALPFGKSKHRLDNNTSNKKPSGETEPASSEQSLTKDSVTKSTIISE
jgi:hypothetical protein